MFKRPRKSEALNLGTGSATRAKSYMFFDKNGEKIGLFGGRLG